MHQEFLNYYLPNIITLATLFISGWWAIKNLKTQMNADKNNLLREFFLYKKYNDTKENLPVLLEILEDLYVLQQGFVYQGRFCPPLEHRAPELSDEDGVSNKMSYAQRAHQFYLIGLRIIKNCRKIIFLTPKNDLSETLKICKELKIFLDGQEENKVSHLKFMTSILVSHLGGNERYNFDHFLKFHEKLADFEKRLESQIEKELPYLTHE